VLADPGNRARAPEPLRLVQAFVNTRDIENGVDELSTPEELARVLEEIGVPARGGAPLGASDLATAVETREALRALALANSGVPVDAESIAILDRVAAAARLTIRFDGREAELVPQAVGLTTALGQVVAVVHDAMTDGTWWRLKACPRDVCLWAFYDRSRNGSGKWCSMSVCGNRTNTKAYRRRTARLGRRATS
jgi:predicted RNA-binding Zn ribbon-like protein